MKGRLWILGWLLVAAGTRAQEPETGSAPADAADTNVTVITSKRLVFDYGKHFALFEEQVVAVHPSLRVESDQMSVQFGEERQIQRLTAVGHVRLAQQDRRAECGKLVYDVVTGEITLTGDPKVWQGEDVMWGRVITVWRDENRMTCEPGNLVIHSAGGEESSFDILQGTPNE